MALSGLAFLIAYLIGLALAFIRHPVYGLYTYVAVFYLHPPSRWWGEYLPDLRWSLLTAVVTLIATLRLPKDTDRPAWHRTTPARILILLTVWIWIQNLWALDAQMHMELAVLYSKYALLFFLVYKLIRTPEELRVFLLLHIAGCAYLGWLGYTMPVSGRLEGVGGPGIDEANSLAMQLGTAVMIAAMLTLAERKWRQWFCIAAMPFILNAIVLAGSRGAFLALLAGGLVLWYLKPEVHRRLFYGLASLGLALLLMLAHGAFWERMSSMKAAVDDSAEVDTSAESRLELIRAQWQMAKDYPLGAGHRGTEDLSPGYLSEEYMSASDDPTRVGRRSSHNTFMTALVEQGVPGAVLFTAGWWWCARAARRLKRADVSWSPQTMAMAAGIAGALAVVFAAGMFVDYFKAEVQIWLIALLASASSLASRTVALHSDSAMRDVASHAATPRAARATRRMTR